MYSYEGLVRVRCVGGLIRKSRTWPPRAVPEIGVAVQLVEERGWQPRLWSQAATGTPEVRVRFVVESYFAAD